MRVLVAEDDDRLRGILRQGLEEEGYVVESFARGDDAMRAGEVASFDLAVLDWNLPGLTGIDICERLQATSAAPAILILTARDDAEDRVTGLNSGADDYLVKPFDFDELLARLHALQRRRANRRGFPTGAGNVILDQQGKIAMVGGKALALTPREFAILERLVMATEPIVSRADLTRSIMADHIAGLDSHSLYVLLSRIRRKLSAAGADVVIETIRTEGFRLRILAAE
jgi:DNA-binding response OmpR family regulator